MVANTITKEEFLRLNEDNLMFITNPGRMWDEDGISFVMKENNAFTIYRVDGWMYGERTEDSILLKDAIKVFPKWNETWENCNNENYQGKYQYIYMGFGNGLSVDKRIYEKYKPYLEKYLTSERKPIEIFTNWKKALADMINNSKDELTINNYECKLGTLEDMNTKWDYEINAHPGDISWIEYKKKFIESFNKGNRISYYGFLDGKIICEVTAIINKDEMTNLEDIVDDKTAYLCAFRTIKEYENKGYFGKLYRYMENDLKEKGYNKLILGVEPSEVRNMQIYFKLGYTNFLKADFDEYEKTTEDSEKERVLVIYYCKDL